jgi:hypothetical protein
MCQLYNKCFLKRQKNSNIQRPYNTNVCRVCMKKDRSVKSIFGVGSADAPQSHEYILSFLGLCSKHIAWNIVFKHPVVLL